KCRTKYQTNELAAGGTCRKVFADANFTALQFQGHTEPGIVMKTILAYIRFGIFAAATFSLYGLWFIVSLVIPNKQFWRQFVFQKWSRAFRRVLRMKVEVVGNVPKRPFFL